MGRAGFKAGSVFAQNLQAGRVTVDPDNTTGDVTTTVTFAHVMKNVPKIALGLATQMATGVLSYGNATESGFQLRVDNAGVTSEINVDYIAFDDSAR